MASSDPSDNWVKIDPGPAGFGWTVFAGTMLLLASLVTGLWALTALFDDSYVRETGLLIGDRTLWGIVLLAVATLQGITGLLVYVGNPKGALLGIAIASVSFTVHLFTIGGYPIWSATAMLIDVMIIYALCAYGFER